MNLLIVYITFGQNYLQISYRSTEKKTYEIAKTKYYFKKIQNNTCFC